MKIYHVTEIIGKYIDWSQIPDKILAEACKRGSWVHSACEAVALNYYIKRKRSDDYGLYVESFIKWFRVNVQEVVHVEHKIVCEKYGFVGRLDFVFVLKTDETVLVDIKTPAALQRTWAAQLSAYDYLLTTEGIEVDAAISLRLKADGGAALGKRYENRNEDFNFFLSALNAHRGLIG